AAPDQAPRARLGPRAKRTRGNEPQSAQRRRRERRERRDQRLSPAPTEASCQRALRLLRELCGRASRALRVQGMRASGARLNSESQPASCVCVVCEVSGRSKVLALAQRTIPLLATALSISPRWTHPRNNEERLRARPIAPVELA